MTSRSIFNVSLKIMSAYYALSALNTLPSGISQMVLFWDSWKYPTGKDPSDWQLITKLHPWQVCSFLSFYFFFQG